MAGKGSAPGERRGGRKKGTPNARTIYLGRLRESGVDPFDLALQIATGEAFDIQKIGTDDNGKPIAVKVPLPWAVRQKSIHELMAYLEPKRKAIEVTGPEGGPVPVNLIPYDSLPGWVNSDLNPDKPKPKAKRKAALKK